jgi:hypothetical protein
MSPLYAELHRWSALPFVWGETDCMMCLADWVWRVRGVDPAAEIRMSYDSPAACQRVTGWWTDPVGAVERCLGAIGGLPRVDCPARGDVGVFRMPDPARGGRLSPAGGLWLGECWTFRHPERGTTTLRARVAGAPLAIWGVGYAA